MTVDRASYHRVLVNAPETLSISFFADGSIVDPGVTTLGIVDAAGNTVVASGTATSGTGAAARTYNLAAQSTLNLLTVTWTSATYGTQETYVEIVGNHLFTLYEARQFDGQALANTSDYPTASIEAARNRITDAFAEICEVSFIPRYRYQTLSGDDTELLHLDSRYRPITAIRTVETRSGTTWTAYDSDDLADLFFDDYGVLYRETRGLFTLGRRNVRVGYEYGYQQVPLEIKRAALRLLVSFLGATQTDWDPRATSMSNEAGVISLATPGLRGSYFGLPEVDSILHRYRRHVPGVG